MSRGLKAMTIRNSLPVDDFSSSDCGLGGSQKCRWLLVVCLCLPSVLWAMPDIVVTGLFKEGAVLRIDGRQYLLRQGQTSVEGVTVVSASVTDVVVEFEGRQQRLSLSRHISGSYVPVAEREVVINRDSHNQYLTHATLNGRRSTVLVDTGANIVALSSRTAKNLGIDYKKGVISQVRTASGVAKSYSVILPSVAVGNLVVSGVEAAVIEGVYPEHVLLGMSYLRHVEMSENNGVMTLRGKY